MLTTFHNHFMSATIHKQKMIKTITTVLILLCFVQPYTQAQQTPKEASSLNYRIIGFSFPATAKAPGYKVEIAQGNYNDEADFKKNIAVTTTCTTNKIIIEVPAFGAAYTWRVTAQNNNRNSTPLYHFNTAKSNNADTAIYRFTVLQNALKFKDAFIFNDGNKVLYNMRGEPVWFLPNIKGVVDETSIIRDLKISPQNTITFLNYNMVYEINYDGVILWRGPNNGKASGDSVESYHHEITRLANGHYMTLGHEALGWEWKYTGNGDSSAVLTGKKPVVNPNGGLKKMALMGTVIEYDESGNVAWSWKSSSYYKGDKLQQLQSPLGMKETHENAFFFDEKRKQLYVSFKNTNKVLKIKYPEGKVMDVYDGLELTTKVGSSNLALFSEQHACKLAANGDLYLYNNNMANSFSAPQVLVLQQPTAPNGQLKTVWKYEYPTGSNRLNRERLTSGGNAIELPDRSMFIASCVPYSNVFIVTRDKKIIWDAFLERFDVLTKTWKHFPQYRASIITSRKKMEDLVWAAQ